MDVFYCLLPVACCILFLSCQSKEKLAILEFLRVLASCILLDLIRAIFHFLPIVIVLDRDFHELLVGLRLHVLPSYVFGNSSPESNLTQKGYEQIVTTTSTSSFEHNGVAVGAKSDFTHIIHHRLLLMFFDVFFECFFWSSICLMFDRTIHIHIHITHHQELPVLSKISQHLQRFVRIIKEIYYPDSKGSQIN